MNKTQLIEELSNAMVRLKRAMARSRDRLLGELQLTKTQIEVIMLLAEEDGQTVGKLAGCLAVTHSASTQTIETLVKRGLVERTNDHDDRRIVRSQLTVSGRKLADQLQEARMKRMNTAFLGFSIDELKLMIAVLGRLEQQFDITQNQKEVQ